MSVVAKPTVSSKDGIKKGEDLVGVIPKGGSGSNEISDEGKNVLVRKFSLGGDAWNKKPSSTKRKPTMRIKSADTIDDEDEDEGRPRGLAGVMEKPQPSKDEATVKKKPVAAKKSVFSRYVNSDLVVDRGSATDSPSERDSTDGGPSETIESGGDDSINVVVRVRPLNSNETEKKETNTVQFPGDGVLWVDSNNSVKPFTFNVLFEPEASQKDVFEHSGVKKLVAMAVDGYACTCFAFGQTGSGKTHSITGPPQKFGNVQMNEELQSGRKLEESDYGLIPRSFHNLLELIADGEKKGISYTLKASYFELYNEQILDLLNMQGGKKLNMRWSANKGFYVENLFSIQCDTFDDLMAVLEEGLNNRSTSAHNMNDFSSRSHSMLTIDIASEQQDAVDENLFITKHGKLTFVDLAGSEKVKDTNTSGDQLLETNNINKSLLVLGKCISALGDPKKKNGHIPYRDSKLTKLLADSIGGNGVTLMIACVSPSKSNQGETMNTLRYATRTKKIKNKPVVKMDPRERLIMTLKKEIKVLKAENQILREHAHVPSEIKSPRDKGKTGDSEDSSVHKLDSKAVMEQFAIENTDLYEMLQQYMVENETLRTENSEYLQSRDRMKRDQQYIVRENDRLQRKVDELQRFILSDKQSLPISHHSTRQNSWHDPHSGMNSANSGSTLRSYHSVPDVYRASYSGPYPLNHSQPVYKPNSMPGLPPVKHKTPPPGGNNNGFRFPQPQGSPQMYNKPSPPRKPQNGPHTQPNTYAQKFEVSKSLGARNAFQHSPPSHGRMMSKQSSVHSSSPHLPMKALPSPPGSHNSTMIGSMNGSMNGSMHGAMPSGYNVRPHGGPPSQPYHQPTHNGSMVGSPMKNTQFDLNEKLKQELMMLEGEIRNTQEVLTTTR